MYVCTTCTVITPVMVPLVSMFNFVPTADTTFITAHKARSVVVFHRNGEC